MGEPIWRVYRLVFAMESPLHVGAGRSGNLQRTRPYVPGRNLWAAVTERLVRQRHQRAAPPDYVRVGDQVRQGLVFSYLYPALADGEAKGHCRGCPAREEPVGGYSTCHWWVAGDRFGYCFMDSQASTALNHDHKAATAGTLHETEHLLRHARPLNGEGQGPQTYLVGALYERIDGAGALTGWDAAVSRLQVGGERGYGWGRLRLVARELQRELAAERPRVALRQGDRVTAHVEGAASVAAVVLHGAVEPLIGWQRNNSGTGSNWHLTPEVRLAYAPGATLAAREAEFLVGDWGRWHYVDA